MAIVTMVCHFVKSSNAFKLFLLTFIAFLLYAFYIWKNTTTFTTITKNIYRNAEAQAKRTIDLSISFQQDVYSGNGVLSNKDPVEKHPITDDGKIYVIITFSNIKRYTELKEKFKTCISSMLSKTRTRIVFYIIGDEYSKDIAEQIMDSVCKKCHQLIHLDVNQISEKFNHIILNMLKSFTIPGHYYNDALFFLSLIIHRVMPPYLHKVIMIDADLKFQSDINQLYRLFGEFKEGNIIGIAKELQPVYRHAFGQYRKHHPGTLVGEPPPNGFTGFNSGVLLLDLDKMRRSQLYNSLIDSQEVFKLTEKYYFKGFLGDQDFFTLLSLEYMNVFYILPCTWNRQLCQWFRYHGYVDVFDEYFMCTGHVNIYHGNCNTSFPT
ncbi:xyloside xylosyltransferase 1-like [Gigantopelta aegis]|uniref:xyloside xylosyltransferase 1-like n=1 Tax=Gigantopelta aegis TaxID=1735272 RepID=UPI001B88E4F2|nr:xyloside xylosyltransferase 1-like [Gigantopelta aegis]